MADRPTPTLTVVMPAYNEAGAIREVVTGWDCQLAALGVPYEIRVYDDGSRDGTAVARWTVRLCFGAGVRDANAPYRLYRRAALERLLAAVSPDAFAPNVILTGLAYRAGLRIVEVPVPYRSRRTGASSIARLKL